MSLESKVSQFLESKIRAGHFSGASVLFGKGEERLLSLNLGTLSSVEKTPVNSSTVFDLQSITKALVTGPLALKLVSMKSLELDSPIDSFLPKSAPRNLQGAGITIRHLLNHSSGVSDVDLEGDFATAFDLWKRIFSVPLHAKPGSTIEYSDCGYRILGKVIEKICGESLESAARRYIFSDSIASQMGYSSLDPFNVAGCPNAHGTIDDEQVRLLGGIVGCDGLFGSADATFKLMGALMEPGALGKSLGDWLTGNTLSLKNQAASFFDALLVGDKSMGWEVNPKDFSYAGRFHSETTFEKAGGAGTFIWLDKTTGFKFVYFTNHGKPSPFDDKTWNRLLYDVDPKGLSDLVYESI
jgi:CubicO group peptidase (beta-lactamase class C family)